MVSAQVKGYLRFYRVDSTGNHIFLFGGNLASLGPSGSSEGAIATTPEKWQFIPLQMDDIKILRVNDQLMATLELTTAATTSASKGKVILPITYKNGSGDVIGDFNNSGYWDVKQLGASAYLTSETVIAIKTIRKECALGSNTNKSFISVEDNA